MRTCSLACAYFWPQPPPADLPSDEWVGASGTQPRCVVIREDDPKPAVAGRFSFRAADVEQLADIGAAAGGSVRREAGAPSFAPPAQVAAPPPPQQQPQPQRQKTPEGERKAAKKRQRAEGAVADGGFRKPPVGGGSFK